MIVTLQQAYNDIKLDIKCKEDVIKIVETLLEVDEDEIEEINIKFSSKANNSNISKDIMGLVGGYDE